jgi:CxxC-x17-CxxC domain-containing protein
MEAPSNSDITYFARTNFRGTDQVFGIKRKDRRQHMYVLGKSGTGKSVMLENMIIQNIQQGEGVCVVDPHGELVEKILETIPPERAKDVIYFNPADIDNNIGFNVLQLDDPRYKHLVASGLMGIFTKIWANAWSSRMEYILNNTILALLDTPDTTLLGIPRMLVDKDYRQFIINNLKDPVVKAFWVHEYEAWRDQFRNEAIAPIQNKVGQFLSSNIVRNVVGQTRSTINIFEIMNTKKIFLVNVSKGRIGEDNSALLGGMLITKLQLSAMERVRIPENKREDFYLYVDEFQNFVTDSFASILSEARKYRLCLILAHQYIAQLETASSSAVKDAVFGNVGTMIIFRVGADDADALEKEFEPEFTVEDFVNLPNYHIYTKLMVDGVTSRPFSARTLPPAEVQTSDEMRNLIIETSRKLYTRPRTVVEEEIQKWSSTVPGQTRPDGEETEGKFKAECSNCKKSIYVPFEPEAGRPIYCKECLFKIKNGELEPTAGFKPPRERKDTTSYDALASLGIEFTSQSNANSKPFVQKMNNLNSFAKKNDPAKNQSTETLKSQDKIPAQAPRIVRAPIKKDRKVPDTSGLKSILQGVLSESLDPLIKNSQNIKQENLEENKEENKEKTPSISLASLRKGSTDPVFHNMQSKEASSDNREMLKNIVMSATNEEEEVSDKDSDIGFSVMSEDDKAQMAQEEKKEQIAEALYGEDAHEEETLKKKQEQEEERIRVEEENKKAEELKKQEEDRNKEIEKQRIKDEQERIRLENIKIEEEKKRVEEERLRLLEETKQLEIRRIEREKEEARIREEKIKEEQRMAEELKKEKELKESENKKEVEKEEMKETISESKSSSKTKKEVPEDILKQILE